MSLPSTSTHVDGRLKWLWSLKASNASCLFFGRCMQLRSAWTSLKQASQLSSSLNAQPRKLGGVCTCAHGDERRAHARARMRLRATSGHQPCGAATENTSRFSATENDMDLRGLQYDQRCRQEKVREQELQTSWRTVGCVGNNAEKAASRLIWESSECSYANFSF